MNRAARVGTTAAAGFAWSVLVPARAAAQEGGGVVEEATSAVGGWAVDRFFDQLAAWIADGLATIVGGVSSAMSSSTTVDPTAVWFSVVLAESGRFPS